MVPTLYFAEWKSLDYPVCFPKQVWTNVFPSCFTGGSNQFTYLYVLSMSSLCASAYVAVICTLFAQLPVVDVRQYKGGAAKIFRFDLQLT